MTDNVALEAIGQALRKFPQLRLCQLFINVTGLETYTYYWSDEKLAEAVRKYIKDHESP